MTDKRKEEKALEERLQEFTTKLEGLEAEEVVLRGKLGAAMVSGKDVKKVEDELFKVTARCNGLKAGIEFAERDLVRLRAEREAEERELLRQELQSKVDRLRSDLLAGAQDLVKIHESAVVSSQELQRVRDVATTAGFPDLASQAQVVSNNFPFAYLENVASMLQQRKAHTRETPLKVLGAE